VKVIVYVELAPGRIGVLHPVPFVVGVGVTVEPPASDVAEWEAAVVFVHWTLPPIGMEIADGLKQNPKSVPQFEAAIIETAAGLVVARAGAPSVAVARSVRRPLAAARRARIPLVYADSLR